MRRRNTTIAATTALAAAALLAILISPQNGQARGESQSDEEKIIRGFAITPVPVKLAGKNLELVGMGSYLVNAVGACSDCHSAGTTTAYSAGGNPYFGQPTKINPATYLGGGRDFGALIPNTPNIVSRNLTPDKSGLPVGGQSFSLFRQVMTTGIDMDHLHPSCSPTLIINCIPPPFNGSLLQVMPWPTYANMSERDLRAIYEYLSAIPCIEGPADPMSPLHNACQ